MQSCEKRTAHTVEKLRRKSESQAKAQTGNENLMDGVMDYVTERKREKESEGERRGEERRGEGRRRGVPPSVFINDLRHPGRFLKRCMERYNGGNPQTPSPPEP